MMEKDTASKLFFKEKEIAAELCSELLFKGKETILPSQLKLMDPSEQYLFRQKDGTLASDNRYRDILYSCTSLEDENEELFRFGIEEQSSVDGNMLPRIMRYDAYEYDRQCQENKGKIVPVFTVVVNFSPSRWTGACSCRELCKESKQKYLDLLPNYHIIVIEPRDLKEDFFQKNYTFLKFVLHCCQNRDNGPMLEKIFETEVPEGNLSKVTIDLLDAILGIKITLKEDGDGKMMCEGFKQLLAAKMAEGEAKGRTEGEAKWKAEGRAEERAKRKLEIAGFIDKALRNGISATVISKITDLPERSIAMISHGDYSCL